mmetsp:Transcript_25414/g.59138  ORF Transcript_25414/g.59138 Transcript_25414/m.59138 type:complete len:433 (-) Transcript_25414:167-1465(-)
MFSSLFGAGADTSSQDGASASAAAPADKPAAASIATTVASDSKKPRAKVKAKKLPPWEQPSDLADERNKDSLTQDVKAMARQLGNQGSQAAASHEEFQGQSMHAMNYLEDEERSPVPPDSRRMTSQSSWGREKKMVLKSYEETVLKSTDEAPPPAVVEEEDEEADEHVAFPSSGSSSSDSADGRGKETFEDKWKEREEELKNEIRAKKEEAQTAKLQAIRSTQAARTIQMIVRMKHEYKKQRMQRYKEAEESGRDQLVREKKMLTWVSLFSVLAKFDEHLQKRNCMEKLNEKVLKGLPPPPPPPPKGAPPSEEDELLHDEYERERAKYVRQWTREGEMTLGHDRFEQMRNNPSGYAQKQKELIAKVQMRKAMKALSEQQFQECLRKAWRLTNDWQPMEHCKTPEWQQEFLEAHKAELALEAQHVDDVGVYET